MAFCLSSDGNLAAPEEGRVASWKYGDLRVAVGHLSMPSPVHFAFGFREAPFFPNSLIFSESTMSRGLS